jgi:hypothetical protein
MAASRARTAPIRDLFDTWQYDIRWAAQNLRDAGPAGVDEAASGAMAAHIEPVAST